MAAAPTAEATPDGVQMLDEYADETYLQKYRRFDVFTTPALEDRIKRDVHDVLASKWVKLNDQEELCHMMICYIGRKKWWDKRRKDEAEEYRKGYEAKVKELEAIKRDAKLSPKDSSEEQDLKRKKRIEANEERERELITTTIKLLTRKVCEVDTKLGNLTESVLPMVTERWQKVREKEKEEKPVEATAAVPPRTPPR